jgi:hypothetical protein
MLKMFRGYLIPSRIYKYWPPPLTPCIPSFAECLEFFGYKKEKGQYYCKYCPQVEKVQSAMIAHVSKSHPKHKRKFVICFIT